MVEPGWILVWNYFSKYHKNCTTYDSGWCNVANKRQFNPTEQMIVDYRSGTIVYTYKGIFNYCEVVNEIILKINANYLNNYKNTKTLLIKAY